MDESWRKSMGISGTSTTAGTALESKDFDNVFGGPPRSVLSRKMSADFSGNDRFYNEIFRPQPSELDSQAIISGRKLPEFVIPERRRSKNRQLKSMSRSKSTSSSVMSFDEMNELNNFGSAAVIGEEDVILSSDTSNLRPLNVPRTATSKTKTNNESQDLPVYGFPNTSACLDKNKYITNITSEYDMENPSNSIVVPPHHGAERRTMNFNYEDSYFSNEVNYVMVPVEGSNPEQINVAEAIAWRKEKFEGWSSYNNTRGVIKEQEINYFTITR